MKDKREMNKKHHFYKMHFKILMLCMGCTILALVLQTVLFQKASSELIYRQSEDEIEYSLQNLQDDLFSFIKTIESGMIDIYKEEDFLKDLRSGMDIENLKKKYYRLAFYLGKESFDTSNGVLSLYLYDTQHRGISTYRRAVTPKHNYPTDIYEDEKLYHADKVKEYIESDETMTLISSYYNRDRERDILRFVLKIYNPRSRDKMLGYVVCDVDTKVIQYLMEKYYVNEEAVIWLQPDGDRPVFCLGKPDAEAEKKIKKLEQTIEEGEQKQEVSIPIEDRVFFKVAQKKYNLSAYALMPQSLLRENQKNLNRNLILTAGFCIILAILISMFISKTLTKPLENMTRTTQRIKAGETTLRIQEYKEDELGELAQNFNEMLDQIEELIAKEYKAKISLNQAKYNALQAQINPHFLYNTLDTMSSIADVRGCMEVSALCQSLSNIFRYSLEMENPFSTVAGEIVHLKNYIYVMNVRMREEITYEFKIEDSVLKSTMPRLSIQPLVENAVIHGLRGSRKKKKIIISAQKTGDNLCISVEDNGVGIAKEEQEALLNSDRKNGTKSIGLNNIHSRMKILYGEMYGVTIESRMDEGTRVSILIPSVQMEEIELWKEKNTKY